MGLMWMGMLGAFVLGSHGVLWLDESLTVSLAREDGPFEYGTAAIFLVASLSAAVLFARSESGNDLRLFRTRRNVFYLLLSLLFAFGAGEEISWGQRIIEFDTPEAIRRINVNGEFNIHNLWLFDRRGTAAHSESPLLVFLTIDRINGFIEVISPDQRVQGDCNGNGWLDAIDAYCAAEMAVQLRQPDLVADLDGDGRVTSRDAVLILQ